MMICVLSCPGSTWSELLCSQPSRSRHYPTRGILLGSRCSKCAHLSLHHHKICSVMKGAMVQSLSPCVWHDRDLHGVDEVRSGKGRQQEHPVLGRDAGPKSRRHCRKEEFNWCLHNPLKAVPLSASPQPFHQPQAHPSLCHQAAHQSSILKSHRALYGSVKPSGNCWHQPSLRSHKSSHGKVSSSPPKARHSMCASRARSCVQLGMGGLDGHCPGRDALHAEASSWRVNSERLRKLLGKRAG